MKQKRKVKSLLPQKNDWRSSFLTAVLLILSVALCIGSASLVTSRVRAVEPGEIGVFDYNGLDEKQEVIYGMRFVDPAYMRTEVNNMYIKGKSFYITPNSVIVNPMTVGGDNIDTNINKVNPGVYGHVLGGKYNVVNSDNVTLIAGENNVVTEGNANAAFLGGQSNNNFGRMREGGTPMVVVGGSNNSIGDNHDGVALIGGNGNKIWDNVSDSFILGGEDNEIGTDRTNVIVGGKKVKVRNVDNVFVYSNKGDGTNPNYEFEPQSSDSFYLNVGNGVGINTNPSNRGLAVGGVVNLGDIDIRTLECNEDNLGVEGKVSNCVVGCTKASLPRGQWEMLDRGVECQAVCGGIPGNRCIFTGEVIEPAPSYDSYCTPADFTGHSHMCYEDELEEYGNSVFETSLIDSDKECPASDENENKCVYQCDDGYHLTGNVTGGKPGTYRCYKDCEYQWENGEKIIYKHNETVTGYNANTVVCSNDIYIFPRLTQLNNKGIPSYAYTIQNITLNGVTYNKRAKNGKSPESCVNYDHQKKLVCNDGTMYLTLSDGKKADTTMKARDNGYIYQDCNTANYTCDGSYDLNRTAITNSFADGGLDDSGDGWNNKLDRDQFSLTRGQYKLCLDYEGNGKTCDATDKLNPHEVHYKFIKCNTPYYTEYPAGSEHCMKSCSVTLNGGKYTNIPHGQTKDFYKSSEETCLDRCEWATFTCDDGKWIQSGTNQVRNETSPYQYYGCTQKDKLCDRAVYNVSQKEHDDHISTSLYEESCDEYDGKQRNICDFTLTVYRLTGCKPGYHTENGKWCVDNVKDMACPSKPSNSHWVRTSGPIQNYPWSNIITKYKTTLNAGWYLVWWNESCAWNDPISCWTDELQPGNGGKVSPGNACEWACDTGYIRNGNTCRYIETTCKYPDGDQSACTNDEPYGCEDVDARTQKEGQGAGEGEWRWECTNDKTSEACLICKDGYHLEKDASGNRKCKPNVNGMCDPNPSGNYGCLAGLIDERSDLDESKYTWWCRGIDGYDRSHDEGPYCSSATDVDNCYKCKPGYHKTSNYGECLINECSSTNRPSGDGVIYGEGTPDTHNKSWSYVSSSYLGACQWTCDESEGYERYGNGCRLKTYTITYNGNGGTPDRASDTVTHGDSVYLPGATRDCHNFDYWMEGSSRQWSPYGPVYADATLTAHWTEDEFTVQYRNNGHGIAPASQTMKYSTETKVRNGITANDGYKFVNWCTAGGTCYNPGDVINATNACPTQDLVLYAQWTENTALLTYDANGCGVAPDPEILTYSSATYAATSMKSINDGWTLDRWCEQPNGGNGSTCYSKGQVVKPVNTTPTSVTLYAQCTQPNRECVNYDTYKKCTDGITGTPTTGPDSDKIYWMCGSSRCEMCDEDEGYVYQDGSCVKNVASEDGVCDFATAGCSAGSYQFLDHPGNVGTVWRCNGIGGGIGHQCRLMWNCGGGSCSYDSSAGCEGGISFYPNNGLGYGGFSRDDCVSAGYQRTAVGSIEPCYLITSLGAPYNTLSKCNSTYGGYGGCAKWTVTVKCEEQDIPDGQSTSPTTTYNGSDAETKCSAVSAYRPSSCSSSTPSSSSTCSHKITYKPNGGKFSDGSMNDKVEYVECGQSTLLVGGLTKAGYTFTKWKVNVAGVNAYYEAGKTYTPTTDVVLIAQWDEKTATLTYDANSCGTAPNSVTMTYSSVTYAATSMKSINDGWTLDRWCEQPNGGNGSTCYSKGQVVKPVNTTPTSVTLYAQCTQPNRECVNYDTYKKCTDGITGTPTTGPDSDKKYWMCGSNRCEMCADDYTYQGGICVQQKTCEEIYHGYGYYSSNPTSDCSREVSVSNAIGGKCYVIGCKAIGRKNNYYNDDLVCSQGKGNGFFVGPLYKGLYCALPSSSGGGGGGQGYEHGWFNVGTTSSEGLELCDCHDPTLYGCETLGDVCVLGNPLYDGRTPNIDKYIKFECKYGYFFENGVTPPAEICGKIQSHG